MKEARGYPIPQNLETLRRRWATIDKIPDYKCFIIRRMNDFHIIFCRAERQSKSLWDQVVRKHHTCSHIRCNINVLKRIKRYNLLKLWNRAQKHGNSIPQRLL